MPPAKPILVNLPPISVSSKGRATIGNEQVAKEYNAWITQLYHQRKTPEKIEDQVTAQMLYALPYSEDYKRNLRGKA